MGVSLVDRWVSARRALTEAEDSGDWEKAERGAEAARRELLDLESRMNEEELRKARSLFDRWFRLYLES